MQTITWTSTTKLTCWQDTPSPIVLCVLPDKLAQKNCPIGESPELTPKTSYNWKTLEATLMFATLSPDGCGNNVYTYAAQYDETLLNTGAILTTSDIQGAYCSDCREQRVKDLVGNDVVVVNDPNLHQLVLINQHGCQYGLGELDGAALASGVWGEGALDLPDCDILNGVEIYLDSNNQFRAAPASPYIQPVRVSSITSYAGAPPADGTLGELVTLSYTNETCKPVSWMPFIEYPLCLFVMAPGNDWIVSLEITPSYGSPNTPVILNFSNVAAAGNASLQGGGGMTNFPGPTIVNPGDTVSITMQWRFNRGTFASDAGNHVGIDGPHASFIAHVL